MRRTPLIGKPLRVLTPPPHLNSSSNDESSFHVSLNEEDILSCVKDLSEIFNGSDEEVEEEEEHKFVLSPSPTTVEDDSIVEAKCEHEFHQWSKEKLVRVLKSTMSKRDTLKSALDVMENAYNRQERNLEAMRVNRIEELKRRVEKANRQVSDLSPAPPSLTTNNNNDKEEKKKTALLRVAMEKEQIQKQYEELQKKFRETKKKTDTTTNSKWTRIFTHNTQSSKKNSNVVVEKLTFPNLNIIESDEDILIQIYEKWCELHAWSRAMSLQSKRSRFESKISKWRDIYL